MYIIRLQPVLLALYDYLSPNTKKQWLHAHTHIPIATTQALHGGHVQLLG